MLTNILLLLVNAAGSFLTLMLLARFYMQWQRISFRNQIGQFVVTTTDWLVRPLRRFVPGVFGLDMASLLPAFVGVAVLVGVTVGVGVCVGSSVGGVVGVEVAAGATCCTRCWAGMGVAVAGTGVAVGGATTGWLVS